MFFVILNGASYHLKILRDFSISQLDFTKNTFLLGRSINGFEQQLESGNDMQFGTNPVEKKNNR